MDDRDTPTGSSANTNGAVALAVTLLVASGIGYRVMGGRLSEIHASVPLPRGTLGRLPVQIGEWRGVDTPLDAAVVEATDTDDQLCRSYTRRGGRGAVALFVGYGVRMRDLMPHRPDVCYPGAGWTLSSRKALDFPMEGGDVLPCIEYRFERGGAKNSRIAVLNYYDISGTLNRDVSLLRSKASRTDDDVDYVVQVQMVTAIRPFGGGGDTQGAQSFAVQMAPQLRELLAEVVSEQRAEAELRSPSNAAN